MSLKYCKIVCIHRRVVSTYDRVNVCHLYVVSEDAWKVCVLCPLSVIIRNYYNITLLLVSHERENQTTEFSWKR